VHHKTSPIKSTRFKNHRCNVNSTPLSSQWTASTQNTVSTPGDATRRNVVDGADVDVPDATRSTVCSRDGQFLAKWPGFHTVNSSNPKADASVPSTPHTWSPAPRQSTSSRHRCVRPRRRTTRRFPWLSKPEAARWLDDAAEVAFHSGLPQCLAANQLP
jgi:hypothetical protein